MTDKVLHVNVFVPSHEYEALQKDAERYRWLCATLGETQLPTLIERITNGYVADYKPSIDATIDAAMLAAPAVGAA